MTESKDAPKINFYDVPLHLVTAAHTKGQQCGSLLIQSQNIDQAIDYALRWLDVFQERFGNRLLSLLVAVPQHKPEMRPPALYAPAAGVVSVLLSWERMVPK